MSYLVERPVSSHTRKRRFAYGLGIAVLSAAGLIASARQSPVAGPKGTTGKGNVTGTVLVAGVQGPAPEAMVSLRSIDTLAAQQVLTDGAGRFRFDGVPVGRYVVHVAKRGFVSNTYGAKSRGTTGVVVVVRGGESTGGIDVLLSKGATISGKITDDKGSAVVGAQVSAVQHVASEAGSHWLRAAVVSSDDTGSYRLFGLDDGDYSVVVVRTDLGSSSVSHILQPGTLLSGTQPAAGSRGLEYQPVFYPGTNSPSDLHTIGIRNGADRSNIDIVFRAIPAATILGRVLAQQGTSPAGLRVTLGSPLDSVWSALGVPRFRSASIGSDGRFEFRAVPRGDYTVFATATSGGVVAKGVRPGVGLGSWFALAKATVGDERLIGMDALRLSKASTLSGRVTPKGDIGSSPLNPTAVSVRLSSISQPDIEIPAVNVEPNWTIKWEGIPPGAYTVAVAVAPKPGVDRSWHARNITVGGKDATDAAADIGFGPNEDEVAIEMSNKVTELTGTAISAAGPTSDVYLVIFPANPTLWRAGSRWLRVPGRPALDGTFRVVGLPPGDYRIAAVEDYEASGWWLPAFLSSLIPSSIQIRLVEGETVAQNIAVGRASVLRLVARIRSAARPTQPPAADWFRETVQKRGLSRDPWR